MATIKTTIFKSKQRKDGTWLVYLLIIHEGKKKYLPTTVYLGKKDITPSFKIRNKEVLEKLDGLVYEYRKRLNTLDTDITGMDIATLVKLLRRDRNRAVNISEYFEKVWLKDFSDKKGLKNYCTAIRSFGRFLGHTPIMADDITVKTMKGFERFLKEKPRAASMYCMAVAKVFGDAREYFNDEDNGFYVIKHSLHSYHAPRQGVAKKRAQPVEVIRKIFSLPYDGMKVKGLSSLHDMALDCFRLSFALLGMNSADLFAATDYKDGVITYCRQKTKDRRNDQALMEVKVPDVVKELVEKYRDDERVFNFHRRFSTASNFNRGINLGLKAVGEEIGVEGLQFYAARHSMASIAVNRVGIDRWTVNAMLNHTDTAMRVTELYIERDFTPLNNANQRLMEYVFGTCTK